jgi:hypothetical protein
MDEKVSTLLVNAVGCADLRNKAEVGPLPSVFCGPTVVVAARATLQLVSEHQSPPPLWQPVQPVVMCSW